MNHHPMKTLRLLAIFTFGVLCVLPGAWAANNLLLDFGPTVTLAADATKSPAHSAGVVPAGEITWNTISADTNTLYYGNGTLASGVTLDLGRSAAGVDTINFSDNGFTVSALGSSANTGIYAGTSPVKDGIFGGSGGGNNLAVGMKVSGLPAGAYTIFVHGRNTSASGMTSMRFYATNGVSAASYSFTLNDATVLVTNSTPANTTAFVAGDNYGVMIVTLGTGESLYVASEGTVTTPLAELRGFFNSIEIVPGTPVQPARVTGQPAGKSVYEGVTVKFVATVAGTPPLTNQWRLNGANLTDGGSITGTTNSTLTLRTVTPAMAGNYSLAVSNAGSFDISSNATLTVSTLLNTDQAPNIWNLLPGDRAYISIGGSTGGNERNIAFNPVTTNLLLVSRAGPDPMVVVLNPADGSEKNFLDVTGIPSTVAGVSLGLNTIAVADDGVVYGGSVTVSASSPAFYLYRWLSDSAGSPPVIVFAGDPGAPVQPNLAWADTMAVRGAGTNTQILLAPRTGTNVVILRTGGNDFQTDVPPAMIAVSGVPSGFARYSVAWGPGTNTFWAKTSGGALYLIQFDLNAGTGAVLYAYSTGQVPGGVRGVNVDANQKFMAGVMLDSLGDNLRLYDVSDLATGPVMRDQEAFSTQNVNFNGTACTVFGGSTWLFALDSDNGLKAFRINTNYVPPSVTIVAQPANHTAMEGATVTFTALAASSEPLTYQWKWNGTNDLVNGPNVTGATSNVLTLKHITTNSVGGYSLFASNAFATATSSNGTLTVLPAFNTAQMSNVWTLEAGERGYLGTNSTERGLAWNPVTGSLLLVSRAGPDPMVVVLNPTNGVEKNFLDVTGIPSSVPNVSLGLDTIGVADDGVVFGASVAVTASSTAFYLYRWPNDSAANPPTIVFAGDPAGAVTPNLRWTDSLAVRGAGTNTQILISPGSGTNVVLLRSSDGLDFQNQIPPAVISVSGVSNAFAQFGLAFGPGTNTFWAKTTAGMLYLVQFDPDAGTGTVLYAYGTNNVVAGLRNISTDPAQRYLAGISVDPWPNVRLYNISDLNSGPALRDQEAFSTQNPNTTLGGTGATAIGGGYVFAMDSNNGLKAFLINTNYVPAITPFMLTSITSQGSTVIITWPSLAGQVFRVQSRAFLSSGTWADIGSPITATGTTTSFTNSMSGDSQFYRVRGQ
jgi:hypothetical protein